MNNLQKSTSKAIIAIFETGKFKGASAYSSVSAMKGDTGGLSVGILQTSLMSGNLYLLTKSYTDVNGQYSNDFIQFLPQLKSLDSSLNDNNHIKELYKKAGQDKVMQDIQNQFFDKIYWNPSMNAADKLNIQSPLGQTIVFDGFIQGSFGRIRDMVKLNIKTDGEQKWIAEYVKVRRNWLTNKSELLAKTTYRMDVFNDLISSNNWNLTLPLNVRGVKITETLLNDITELSMEDKNSLSIKTNDERNIMVGMKGDDVKELQKTLINIGYNIKADGDFGLGTEKAVINYQSKMGLIADGIVGNSTKSKLGVI